MSPTVKGSALAGAAEAQAERIRRLIALCGEIKELLMRVDEKKRMLRMLMDQIVEVRDVDSRRES